MTNIFPYPFLNLQSEGNLEGICQNLEVVVEGIEKCWEEDDQHTGINEKDDV